MQTYGRVSIQPSEPKFKQAILRTGFNFNVFFASTAEFYSFSLFGRLRAVGLIAFTRLSTIIDMNCAILNHNICYVSATSII